MTKGLVVLSMAMLVTIACGLGSLTTRSVGQPTTGQLSVTSQVEQDSKRCGTILPPDTFQESDLVGTWIGRPGTATDTLKLNADHTYRQVYDDLTTGDHFEVNQVWWIEQSTSGIPHMHLKGMRICNTTRNCHRQEGGAGDWMWYDYCEDRPRQMQGEAILLIVGTSPGDYFKPLRGIWLALLPADPDSTGTEYWLEGTSFAPPP